VRIVLSHDHPEYMKPGESATGAPGRATDTH
jgi:hypothetical protein